MLEMSHTTEQEAALRVLKTVVPCSVRPKQKEKTSFRYCLLPLVSLYLQAKVGSHISMHSLLDPFSDILLFFVIGIIGIMSVIGLLSMLSFSALVLFFQRQQWHPSHTITQNLLLGTAPMWSNS